MPQIPYDQRKNVNNALEDTFLHRLLVATERLGFLPPLVVYVSLALNALIAGVVWASHGVEIGATAGLGVLAFGALNTAIFTGLPRAGRSWGSWQASVLGLTAFQALLMAILGIFNAPLILAAVVSAIPSVVVYYATWIEPFRVGVTREIFEIAGAGGSFTLMHFSDMHLERISPRERDVLKLIDELKPDVIVYTGDFVNITYTYDKHSERDVRQMVSAWRAPSGVFGIPGTPAVEPMERVIAFTQGIDTFSLLLNRWVTIQPSGSPVHILGVVTTHDLDVDRRGLREAMEKAPQSAGMRVLLSHSPDLAPEAAAAGFDLYLCGHTHGGQIRLPFYGPIFTGSRYGNTYAKGKYTIPKPDGGVMTLYVTRGLGMEGFGAPRARLLCPPEVVIWTISGH